MKRVHPERWLGRRASDSVVLAQDVIEIAGELFELAHKLEALAKPGLTDPSAEVCYKIILWRAQDDSVRELARAKNSLGAVLWNTRRLVAKGFDSDT